MFVNSSGEWKLGGVEYVTTTQESNLPFKKIASLEVYSPPEKNDPSKQRSITKWYIYITDNLAFQYLFIIF